MLVVHKYVLLSFIYVYKAHKWAKLIVNPSHAVICNHYVKLDVHISIFNQCYMYTVISLLKIDE